MWRQCGGKGAAFGKRLLTVAGAVTIVLIGLGLAQNKIPASDPSVEITHAILLSFPIALMGMVL